MKIKRERLDDAASLKDLIGEPSLLPSEDRSAYDELRAAVEREINPRTFFDDLRVQDITDKIWEEQRLKRQQIALIQSAKVQSLASLLAPVDGQDIEGALETARNYYNGDAEKSRKAQRYVHQLGITNEQVEANVIQVRSLVLLAQDRMILTRETARNRLIKGHERRQRKAEKAKRRPVNDNNCD
jgi:hypothetical protein